jgi:hypothetical protein
MLATLENQIRLQGLVTEEQIKDEHRERVVPQAMRFTVLRNEAGLQALAKGVLGGTL